MIEELFDQTFKTMAGNNKNIGPQYRLLAKAMFIVGFGDCYHYMMEVLKKSDPVTGLFTLAHTGTEINDIMKQMEKNGVLRKEEQTEERSVR